MKKLYACLLKAALAVAAVTLPASATASIPSKFKITPGEGASVESITTIEIYGDNDDWLFTNYNPIIKFNGQDVAVTGASSSSASGEDDILTYTLSTPWTEPGECQIVIPAETFYYGYAEANNPEISWTVTVTGGQTPPTPPSGFKPYEYADVTVDPEQGAVTELQTFSFWFKSFSWGDYNSSKTITLVNDATGEVVASGKPTDALSGTSADGSVTLDSKITEPGRYTLIVPEGSFYDLIDDTDCSEYKFAYYIEGEEENPFKPYEYSDCTISPVQGTYGHLQNFVVNFDNLMYVDGDPYVSITLVDDATGQVVATTKGTDGTGMTDGRISFPEAIKKAGNYTLVIPAGAFYDEYYDECSEYKFAYIVDGSEDTGGENPDEFKPYEYPHVTVSPVQGTYGSLRTFEFQLMDLFLVDANSTKTITLVNDATGEVVASAPGETGCGFNGCFVEFDEPITAAGRYTLVVPEGAFYDVYDNENPEYKFAYIIDGSGQPIPEEPEDVSASPVSGSTVTKLSDIMLTFSESFETFEIGSSYRPQGPIVVKDASGKQVATGSVSRGAGVEYYQMRLTLSEPIAEAGEYTVVIPARNIVLEGDEVTRFNRTITLTYTVEPFKPIENKGVTIKPAQGEVSALTAFTVTFADIQLVDINGNYKARLINKASGEEVSGAKVSYGARTWEADVELDTPVTEAGEYILVCEANLFYDGLTDEDFPEYRFAYIVDGSGDIPYAPETVYSDPEENVAVGQLDEIVLSFTDYDQIYQDKDRLSDVSVIDAAGNAVAACTFFFDYETMSGNQIGIRLSTPVTADGTYTITLPRRAFTLGSAISDARFSNVTKLTYIVDSALSIGSVAVDADTDVRYFDLQGRSLQAPVRGQVVIRVAGGKASKVCF